MSLLMLWVLALLVAICFREAVTEWAKGLLMPIASKIANFRARLPRDARRDFRRYN
jgi:hypothetical protein